MPTGRAQRKSTQQPLSPAVWAMQMVCLAVETLDYFGQIIITSTGLSKPAMAFLGGLWMFRIFIFKLDLMARIEHHQLFETAWQQQEVSHHLRGRPQLFLFSDPDIVHPAQWGATLTELLILRGYMTDHSMKQWCPRGFQLSRKTNQIRSKISQRCFKMFPNPFGAVHKTRTTKATTKTSFISKTKNNLPSSCFVWDTQLHLFLFDHILTPSQLGSILSRGTD